MLVEEETISLSKVFKFPFLSETSSEVKTISIKSFEQEITEDTTEKDELVLEEKERAIAAEIERKLQEANEQSAQIIKAAQAEAEKISAQLIQEEEEVRNRLTDIQEEAKQAGFNEGFNQGLESGKAEYEGVIREAHDVVNLAKEDYFRTVEKAEPVILDLALAVAEKIVGDILLSDDNYWKKVIEAAIFEVKEQQEVRLYVHPDWYEKTLKHKDELENMLSQAEQLYIFPDVELTLTSCIVETPYGRIDASVDSQLAEIKKQLHEKLKENRHEGM